MSKTILICGHGPGISAAMAKKFGRAGFKVALVARNSERLQKAAEELKGEGIEAAAFPADMGDPAALTKVVEAVRQQLGPVTVVHWNGYANVAGDLTTAKPEELRQVFDVGIVGLVATVQAALPDLRAQKDAAAVLITGGGFAFYDVHVDTMIAQWNTMGMSLAKAAQHKLAGVLAQKLSPEGIFVGEVVVKSLVKGTAFDQGNASIEPGTVADRFFEIYSARQPNSVAVS